MIAPLLKQWRPGVTGAPLLPLLESGKMPVHLLMRTAGTMTLAIRIAQKPGARQSVK